jgi:DNA-binding transcriptional LysR family regulator
MIDRRLSVLQAIARHGTVTAAAEVCRLTPSAVSHQMQALARELDVVLLEPVGRTVRLTPAAHTLIAHAEALTAQWEHARADLASHRSGDVGGTLRFAGFSSAAAVVVPKALDLLREEHPALRVHLRESEPARSFDPLVDEPLDVLVGPEHPLVGRDGVALSDLAHDPWVCGNRGRAYHQLVTLACTVAGFAPDIAHFADEWDTGAALVARGFGVALVPRLADLPAHHDTRRLPIRTPPVPTRRILAAVRAGSGHQPTIAAGLDALRRVTATDLPALDP